MVGLLVCLLVGSRFHGGGMPRLFLGCGATSASRRLERTQLERCCQDIRTRSLLTSRWRRKQSCSSVWSLSVHRSYENPAIQTAYQEFLGEPCSHKAHDLLVGAILLAPVGGRSDGDHRAPCAAKANQRPRICLFSRPHPSVEHPGSRRDVVLHESCCWPASNFGGWRPDDALPTSEDLSSAPTKLHNPDL